VLEKIQQYGCYCFIDNRFGATPLSLAGNKGTPVDDMDKLCLDLYRCHRCIYDFDHPTEACTVESKYRSFFNDATGEVECDDPANSNCQNSQCHCDRIFAMKIADLWTNQNGDNYQFNRYYWKNVKNGKAGPTFGYKNTCVSSQAPNGQADACCGKAGEKKPYSSLMADCCNDMLTPLGGC